MSNMNHAAFAQAGVQELSFNEIEEVGGAVPLILLAYPIGKAIGYTAAAVGGAAAGVATVKVVKEVAKKVL